MYYLPCRNVAGAGERQGVRRTRTIARLAWESAESSRLVRPPSRFSARRQT